jgi:hypothetical protein
VSGYRVTVTTTKRLDRGRKTIELKTFEYDKANRRWIYYPGRLTTKLDGTGANVDDVISAMMSQNHGRLASSGAVWRIGRAEVSVPAANVIFDAVRNAGRHAVDIDDVKSIVSELGSRVSKLSQLPAEQRRLAEPALHSAIIERCSTV